MTTLAKAKFVRLPTPDASSGTTSLSVQFNPAELNFTKTAQVAEIAIPGLDTPLLQYVRGQAETLSLELFFDSTEDGTGASAKPVTEKTDKFYSLIKAEQATHAPPVLLFLWGGTAFPGKRRDHGFRCVVTSVRQQFTLFAPDGKPLRAKLTVELKEYKPLTLHLAELGFMSADHTKACVVRENDSITAISYREYTDDRRWRGIAEANGITDPLALRAGQILRIPRGAGR
ncbi:MAG TPA: LysM peptidoglycan-binding domain-containing protein [Propionicimonas sp.]|jgi:nucleoid-associated protein YgaU|nr:LysM peptidoglycan-binding domain-containing protein [Propionicimonas sp.]